MSPKEMDLQHQANALVQREVIVCLSELVATLARSQGSVLREVGRGALYDLSNQAFELCAPVLDYEEAARQEGWTVDGEMFVYHAMQTVAESSPLDAFGWNDLCLEQGLDPYEWDVLEHWAVSQWLAEKLIEQGERVDTAFAGLNVWARTTTGQSISMDAVIERITAALHTA